MLKLSVYAAAKFGAKRFLKTVFDSKAGRNVFNAYKENPPLPEVIAWKYGHEETANYLEDITIRYPYSCDLIAALWRAKCACRAPWVRKCGKLSIRENLVIM